MTISITNSRPSGLMKAHNANALRTNGSLLPREWIQYDTEVQDVTRQRAGAFNYLASKGLSMSVPFGATISTYRSMSDVDTITTSILPIANGEKDEQQFREIGVYVPMLMGKFDVDARTLDASRKEGASLDTSGVAALTKNIWIRMNDILANGWGIGKDNAVYGLTNKPGSVSFSITANAWNGTTANAGETVINELNGGLKALYAKNFYGPFVVFVANNMWAAIQQDYSQQKGDNTIKDRMEAFVDVDSVQPLDQLADNKAVIVQVTKDVIDLAVGMDIRPVEFQVGPYHSEFCVVMAACPRVKHNYNDDVGVAVSA